MRNAAGTCSGRIRHHRDGGGLEQFGNGIFLNVTGEDYARIGTMLASNRFNIPGRFGVIASRNYELNVGHTRSNKRERFENLFEPFVGSPFAKREDAMNRITARRKIRWFRAAGKDSMHADMNVVPAIAFAQRAPI